MCDSFGDADARGDLDSTSSAEAIVGEPKTGGGRGEVAAIVAGASDGEGLSEAAGARGELWEIARVVNDYAASTGHLSDSLDRFDGAKKNTAGFAVRFAGNIEAIVVTINEIDVGETRRTEENGIARSATRCGVSGKIVCAEIGFDFDDAG